MNIIFSNGNMKRMRAQNNHAQKQSTDGPVYDSNVSILYIHGSYSLLQRTASNLQMTTFDRNTKQKGKTPL